MGGRLRMGWQGLEEGEEKERKQIETLVPLGWHGKVQLQGRLMTGCQEPLQRHLENGPLGGNAKIEKMKEGAWMKWGQDRKGWELGSGFVERGRPWLTLRSVWESDQLTCYGCWALASAFPVKVE